MPGIGDRACPGSGSFAEDADDLGLGLLPRRQVVAPSEGIVVPGLVELGEQPDVLERLRLGGMHLGALGDQLEDEVARLRAGIDDDRLDVAGPQPLGHVLDALVGGANGRVGRCIHRHAGDPFESDRRWFVVVYWFRTMRHASPSGPI
jgi:hypothetical protein